MLAISKWITYEFCVRKAAELLQYCFANVLQFESNNVFKIYCNLSELDFIEIEKKEIWKFFLWFKKLDLVKLNLSMMIFTFKFTRSWNSDFTDYCISPSCIALSLSTSTCWKKIFTPWSPLFFRWSPPVTWSLFCILTHN